MKSLNVLTKSLLGIMGVLLLAGVGFLLARSPHVHEVVVVEADDDPRLIQKARAVVVIGQVRPRRIVEVGTWKASIAP